MSSLFTEIKSLFLNTVQKRTSNDSFTYKLTQLVDQSLEFDSISINSLFTIILTTFSHCHYTIALPFSNRSAIARTSMYFNMIIKTPKEWVSNIETATRTTERTTERTEKIIELVFVFVEIVKQIYFVNEKEALEVTVNRSI